MCAAQHAAAAQRRRDQHNAQGLRLFAAGRYEAAIEEFRAGFRLDTASHKLLVNAGVSLMALSRLDEAEACYIGAIGLARDCAEAVDNLGVVCKLRGDFDRAIDCHYEALRLAPIRTGPGATWPRHSNTRAARPRPVTFSARCSWSSRTTARQRSAAAWPAW